MTRRVILAVFVSALSVSMLWPKWKEEEQQYLDTQFRTIQEQVQALTNQLQTLNGHVAELRQNQAQLQSIITRQQRALQDLEQLVSSMRISGEENFTGLKNAITQARTETQQSIKELMGRPAQPPPDTGPGRAAQVQGYVTDVKGNIVLVDLGSAKGIRSGARLGLFKATDPNTRVGVLEVTDVVDAANSRAQVVTLNPGVRVDFGDTVRVE